MVRVHVRWGCDGESLMIRREVVSTDPDLKGECFSFHVFPSMSTTARCSFFLVQSEQATEHHHFLYLAACHFPSAYEINILHVGWPESYLRCHTCNFKIIKGGCITWVRAVLINSLSSDMVRVSTFAYPLSSGAAEGSPVSAYVYCLSYFLCENLAVANTGESSGTWRTVPSLRVFILLLFLTTSKQL